MGSSHSGDGEIGGGNDDLGETIVFWEFVVVVVSPWRSLWCCWFTCLLYKTLEWFLGVWIELIIFASSLLLSRAVSTWQWTINDMEHLKLKILLWNWFGQWKQFCMCRIAPVICTINATTTTPHLSLLVHLSFFSIQLRRWLVPLLEPGYNKQDERSVRRG